MPSLGSLLLLALIFVTIGFIGGALVSLLWFDRERGEETETEAKPTSKQEKDEQVEGAVQIWNDPEDGQLVIKVGGHQYRNSKDMEETARLSLEKMALSWISWLRSSNKSLTEPKPRSEFLISEETESRLVQVTAPVEVENQDLLSDSKLEPNRLNNPVQDLENKSAKLNQSDFQPYGVENAFIPKEVEKKRPTSIVGQIDEILQELLEDADQPVNSIRLVDDPKGGVIVWVGVEKFSGIDAVPDQDVQQLIRSAVQEWEQRSDNR